MAKKSHIYYIEWFVSPSFEEFYWQEYHRQHHGPLSAELKDEFKIGRKSWSYCIALIDEQKTTKARSIIRSYNYLIKELPFIKFRIIKETSIVEKEEMAIYNV